jgi:hypothetical protein
VVLGTWSAGDRAQLGLRLETPAAVNVAHSSGVVGRNSPGGRSVAIGIVRPVAVEMTKRTRRRLARFSVRIGEPQIYAHALARAGNGGPTARRWFLTAALETAGEATCDASGANPGADQGIDGREA